MGFQRDRSQERKDGMNLTCTGQAVMTVRKQAPQVRSVSSAVGGKPAFQLRMRTTGGCRYMGGWAKCAIREMCFSNEKAKEERERREAMKQGKFREGDLL